MRGVRREKATILCRNDVSSVSRGAPRDRQFLIAIRCYPPPLLLPAFSTIRSALASQPLPPPFPFFPAIKKATECVNECNLLDVLFAYPASTILLPFPRGGFQRGAFVPRWKYTEKGIFVEVGRRNAGIEIRFFEIDWGQFLHGF